MNIMKINLEVVPVNPTAKKAIIIMFMMMFIWIQWTHRPFLDLETNQAEFILLAAFPVVIMISLLVDLISDTAAAVLMSIMVLLPIPLTLLFISRMMQHKWMLYATDDELPEDLEGPTTNGDPQNVTAVSDSPRNSGIATLNAPQHPPHKHVVSDS